MPNVVDILNTGELRYTSRLHQGEKIDDQVSVPSQDEESTATQSVIQLKVLAILKI